MHLTDDVGRLRMRAGLFRFLSLAQRRSVVSLDETTDARGCAADSSNVLGSAEFHKWFLSSITKGRLGARGGRACEVPLPHGETARERERRKKPARRVGFALRRRDARQIASGLHSLSVVANVAQLKRHVGMRCKHERPVPAHADAAASERSVGSDGGSGRHRHSNDVRSLEDSGARRA